MYGVINEKQFNQAATIIINDKTVNEVDKFK